MTQDLAIPAPQIRGFNYSGSWGTSGLDLWQHHDQGLMAVEVARGKRYFPGWNTARWWLSHESFQRNPERFLANFEAGLAVFAAHDILVIPVLFNRWRDPVCDFGGVSLEHIVPELGLFSRPGDFASASDEGSDSGWVIGGVHRRYLEAVVGAHAADPRILTWDLCNEPLMGPYVDDDESFVVKAELRWLTWVGDVVRAAGATQPITIGNCPSVRMISITESIVDVVSFHPYYVPSTADEPIATRPGFEAFLDEVVAIAAKAGKPLVANETVWGSLDDAERVELLRYTLGQLADRKIGFTAHALHHSLVADLHAPEWGPVWGPGRLEFIEADGSLRPGHDAFNDY
jgi:hypothetical protein